MPARVIDILVDGGASMRVRIDETVVNGGRPINLSPYEAHEEVYMPRRTVRRQDGPAAAPELLAGARFEGRFVVHGLQFRPLANGDKTVVVLQAEFDAEQFGSMAALANKLCVVTLQEQVDPVLTDANGVPIDQMSVTLMPIEANIARHGQRLVGSPAAEDVDDGVPIDESAVGTGM